MEKLLLERQTDFDARVLLTSVDEAAKLLLDTKAKLEEQGWSDIHLEMVYSIDSSPELALYGKRLETDGEFKLRVERAEQAVKLKEDRERKEYERLKAKYGEQTLTGEVKLNASC